jgi:hypothetical protein
MFFEFLYGQLFYLQERKNKFKKDKPAKLFHKYVCQFPDSHILFIQKYNFNIIKLIICFIVVANFQQEELRMANTATSLQTYLNSLFRSKFIGKKKWQLDLNPCDYFLWE